MTVRQHRMHGIAEMYRESSRRSLIILIGRY